MWGFENYTVYKETDLLRFENTKGEILGYISFDDGGEELVNQLNNGANPIEDDWEDGNGNIVSINGWLNLE